MSHESTETTIARIETKIDGLTEAFSSAKELYVTQDQFKPVRLIVYGMVGIILTAVLTTLVYSVIIKGSNRLTASAEVINK